MGLGQNRSGKMGGSNSGWQLANIVHVGWLSILIGLVVKGSVSRAANLGFSSHLLQDFSGSSYTSDFKN